MDSYGTGIDVDLADEVGQLESSGAQSDYSRRSKPPFLTELSLSRQQTTVKKKKTTDSTAAVDFQPSAVNDDGSAVTWTCKQGPLSKMTKCGARKGPTRNRHFCLTEDALEYSHTFSKVKVKRRLPLISIEKVEYNTLSDTQFSLVFSNFTVILRAKTADDAKDWVEKIKEASAKWDVSSVAESSFDQTQQYSEDQPHQGEIVESEDKLKKAELEPPKRVESLYHPREDIHHERLLAKHHFKSSVSKGQRRFTASISTTKLRANVDKVDFELMKYPRANTLGLPSIRQFKFDRDNKQIMWKRYDLSKFQEKRSMSLQKVVEVREGQNTDMFDKFPYPKAEKQSFSLVYQQEDKRYAYLTSLNIICGDSKDYDVLKNELKTKVSGQEDSSCYLRTDTTLLWLKQIWSCKSENGELHERTAIKLAKKLNPFITEEQAKIIVANARACQIKAIYRQTSLDFGGFIFMFNLLRTESIPEIKEDRLHSIFKEYAKTSPQLGMTLKEFREFLVNECCVRLKLLQESSTKV